MYVPAEDLEDQILYFIFVQLCQNQFFASFGFTIYHKHFTDQNEIWCADEAMLRLSILRLLLSKIFF